MRKPTSVAMVFIDGDIELIQIRCDVAQLHVPKADPGIARAQPHRQLEVGFGLFEVAQGIFRHASERV